MKFSVIGYYYKGLDGSMGVGSLVLPYDDLPSTPDGYEQFTQDKRHEMGLVDFILLSISSLRDPS